MSARLHGFVMRLWRVIPWVRRRIASESRGTVERIAAAFAEGGPASLTIQRGTATPREVTELIRAVSNLSETMGRDSIVSIVFPDGTRRGVTAEEVGWQSLEWDQLTITI